MNKRVRALEESGYVKRTGAKKTKAGFEAIIYEMTAKGYVAILLDSTDFEHLVERLDETVASELLAAIIKSIDQ